MLSGVPIQPLDEKGVKMPGALLVKMASLQRTFGISLVLSLLTVSEGITIQRDTPQPLNPPGFNDWAYMGCYSDSQSSRTLPVLYYSGEYTDDDSCIYKCKQAGAGYIYAGVEFGGQCFCGTYVNSAATKKPESDCNMACTKTKTQACGAADRINLYNLIGGTPSSQPAAATVNPGPNGWVSQGCWSDSVGVRTLSNKVSVPGALTVASCTSACSAAGYSLAGVEYGSECYCDNTYQNGGSISADKCTMTCKGNSGEFCGDAIALNLYSYQGATPVAATQSGQTLPSNWASLGCYTDDVKARGLSVSLNLASLTIEKCVNACASKGYSVAGVEYGQECRCDNAIQNKQGQAPDGSAGCNMPCNGNSAQTCGGKQKMNVYAAGPAWAYLGCYTDQVYHRTLSTVGAYDGQLTIEKCQASCQAAGFPYAGLELASECFCGSSFENGGGVALNGNAGCTFVCQGNSNQICGGNSKMSMYGYVTSAGTIAAAQAL
ncbi:hypothetical protein VTL71DRAFT_14504 [Oculimacula yallundae]|uniref:WSC domain-containing protein n=1 Tax=Oculimacula yallundae TaxID=86028 RepID=A0ABR4CIM5_9HELO